jgi:hypothetical protein
MRSSPHRSRRPRSPPSRAQLDPAPLPSLPETSNQARSDRGERVGCLTDACPVETSAWPRRAREHDLRSAALDREGLTRRYRAVA